MAIIEGINVTKTYLSGKTQFQALQGINLALEKGDFAVLAGPSGSGKTTLLNLIGGLDTPTQGEIKILNENIGNCSDQQLTKIRRTKIGFIFQHFNLIPTLTSYENVELTLVLRKLPPQVRHEKTMRLLEEVGLADKARNFPTELSGGQQQRVAIARALVGDPVIILADEPTANLDSQTGQSIVNLLKRFNETQNVTILFSTHDQNIMKYAKRIIHLKDGVVDQEEKFA